MKKNEKVLLNVVKKLADGEVKRNEFRWPPMCIGIYHQPKRPKNDKE
ncbi:MAG: AgrD family cyclic lactone autoinducer peptide [Lachnospiraceae bacterium]